MTSLSEEGAVTNSPGSLPLASIRESKSNPRTHHDEHAHAELTESVRKLGVIQAVVVRPKGNAYELVCGHRRFRAAAAAGLEEIPAVVRELSDLEVLEIQLVENLQRNDLHPLDEADGYRRLMATKKYDAAKIAERTGRSVKYVYDRVKLLELTKEAQQLLRDGKITAGHAILLARLSAKDQTRAIDPQVNRGYGSHGVWQGEHALFDPDGDESKDKYHGLKAVSVRELQAWVDRTVRLDRKNVEPLLFPETAAAIETATKIVPITYDSGLSPDLKGDERTICVQSWKRADGKQGSKTCEHSILGVIVVGRDRGQAFDVCANKDKCKTHWAKEAAARKRAKAGGKRVAQSFRDEKSYQIEEAKRKAKAAAWEKVIPAVLDAFAAAVAKAPTKATGLLAKTIMDHIYIGRQANAAGKVIPLGATAEDFMRNVAFQLLAAKIADVWNADREVPKLGKAFGIDVAKIMKAATPAKVRTCRKCGCTDDDCEQCVKKTGGPCSWVEKDLCSACVPPGAESDAKPKKRAPKK
jgi:ParB/RepB/Spo0J family partition protein